MKREFIVKVEKDGIIISKERLSGINEGDLVNVKIEKAYADDDVKKALKFAIVR
jgi:hypothetical protein